MASIFGPASSSADEIEVIFLANEGFLVVSGESKLLIDAIFGKGLRGYGSVEEEIRDSLEAALPPFDGVQLVLASHVHPDHFDAAAMARFLRSSPGSELISTPDAVDELLTEDGSGELSERVRGLWPSEEEAATIQLGDFDLTVLNLHHGREPPITQNLGFLIEVCGLALLHVGDTEVNSDDLRRVGLEALQPDIALLPSWFLRPSRWSPSTRDILRPRSIIAMHLPSPEASAGYFYGGATNLEELIGLVQREFPGAWIPLRTGESKSFQCPAG